MGVTSLRTPLITVFLLGLVPSGAPAAQARSSVDQIGTPQAVGMQQVAPRSSAAAAVRPVPQLSGIGESGPPVQLTSERGSGKSAEQLTRGARSAQSSQPLSRPRDGRLTAVDRLDGDDRCDPRTRRPRPARCAQAIETRAAEFSREKPLGLSPEQRIIAEQQARERAGNFGSAARRLAASGDDAGSLEAQGVASIALAPPTERAKSDVAAPGTVPSEAVISIINAIVNAQMPQQ